jgi:TRAP transporter TAXI family solute receptor
LESAIRALSFKGVEKKLINKRGKEKRMKRIIFLTLAVILAIAWSTQTHAQKGPVKSKMPSIIGVGTTSLGSTGNAMAVAYAPILEKWLGGVKVRVMPAESSLVMVGRMKDGTVLFHGGGITVPSLGSAIQGTDMFATEGWGPQSKLRIVWYNYSCPYGIVVKGDSKIKSMADLKGKKGSMYKGSPMWINGFDGCLAFAGLIRDQVTVIETGGYTPVAQAVADGRADFTYLAPISTVTYEIEQNPFGIRWIPMPLENKAGWDRVMKKCPLYGYGNVETGVNSARGIPMQIVDFVMAAHEDAEGIYEIAKFFGEAFNQYKDLHKNAGEMSIKDLKRFMSISPVPFHPGTIKYLKEKGIWTNKDDGWNEEQIALAKKYEGAWSDAVKEGKTKKLKIDYQNKDWISLWDGYRGKLPVFRTR